MQKRGSRLLSFAVVLCMLMLVFAGCADTSEDIVGKVGETPIYRWYFNSRLVNQVNLQYTYTGVDLTLSENKEKYESLKKSILVDVAAEAAVWEEARVRGLAQLSDEQEAEVDKLYDNYFNSHIEKYMEQYGQDNDGRKKAEQAYLELLKKSSLTPERVRETYRYNYISNLLAKEQEDALPPLTDEDIKKEYDTRLEKETATFTEDPLAFGTDVTDASTYIPEGYSDTGRITLKFNNKQQAAISEAYRAQVTAMTDYANAVLAGGETSADAKRASAAIDRTTANFEKTMENAYQELEKSMQEILDEVRGGADFVKTMEAKSEDNHLISYYVCAGSTHVEESYLTAALKLQNEGDISDIVRLEQGVCIIYLFEKLTPGVRTFEQVRDAIYAELNRSRTLSISRALQSDCYAAAEEAGIIELYEDML